MIMYVPRPIALELMIKQVGFSLIEMAIVLVIVGLLLGGSLVPLSAQMERSRRSETSQILKNTIDAIYGYAFDNGRFPCPDDPLNSGDGVEDRTGVDCSVLSGNLPWVTLGSTRTDAWGQNIIYRMTNNFADTTDGTGCGTPTAGVSFELCSAGDIQILDGSPGGNPVAVNIPAVIISRGKNWAISTSTDEAENTDADGIFVSKQYTNTAGSEFDDLIVWIAPTILKSRMVSAGRLP